MTMMKRIWVILKSVAISYVIMLILLMIYAFLLANTGISESTIPTVVFVITLISVFMGSSLSMLQLRENGLVNGGIVGLLYVLLLYLLSSIFGTGFGLNGYAFGMILFSVLIGMIGGIIGVNLLKEERKRT